MNTTWREHIHPDTRTLRGKRVLIRVDWNLPLDTRGEIADLSRYNITVPFLKKLSAEGAKIIIVSHFGEKGESILPVAHHALKDLSFLSFTPSKDFKELETSSRSLEEGKGIILENIRTFEGETENSRPLAENLSLLGDIFINDAFSVSHREHASVVGVARVMLSYIGPNCARELEHLEKALLPKNPALFIVGGAKIATKLTLIKEYLNKGVKVFVGGAMVHNIWKEKGKEIGQSLYDPNYKLPETFVNHPLLITPVDVVLATGDTVSVDAIPKDGVVVDCGPKTAAMLGGVIGLSNTIIVNGPLGLYEKGWLHGSEQILVKVAESTADTYIGGGDTVTVAHSLHLLQKFTFVSLGGGAMLDYLATGTLPGIDAVTK